MEKWIEEEFIELSFGDKRVDKTGKKIIQDLSQHPNESIPVAFQTWTETKSCYEFFANGKVTWEKILLPHRKATIKRIQQEPIVLLPTDTTDLNYTSKPSIKDLGDLTNKNKGIYLHPLLAITPERVSLGVVGVNFLKRTKKVVKLTNHEVYAAPIESKENYKWIESYQEACEVSKKCPNTQVITITDREGDFAELFEVVWKVKQSNEKHADIIVRSYHDRALDSDNTESLKLEEKLRNKLKNAPILGEISFKTSKNSNGKGRVISQKIRAAQVTFKKRATSKNSKNERITINAVMAIEENPPEGMESLIWVFLTTLPVSKFEEAIKVIKYYLARWEIEVFFKVLKSGCAVEKRRFGESGKLLSLIAIFIVIAWRVMYIMKVSRLNPEICCEEFFSSWEWKSVYKISKQGSQLPQIPPTLGEFTILVAKLGGYLARKNDPPPGPKMLWIGLKRMHDFALAMEIFEGKSKM